MKKFLQLFLIVLVVSSIALSGNQRMKVDIEATPISISSIQPENATVASSPWLPRNLETATSQYKVLDFFPNGVVLIAGAKTTAPMLGNYYGFYSKDSGKSFTKFSFPNFQSSGTSTSMRFVNIASNGDSVFILADYNGVLQRSHDWGKTWDTITVAGVTGSVNKNYGTGAFYDGIKFVGRDTVVAYGDAVDSTIFVARSTDRGVTWNRITLSAKLTSDFGTYPYGAASSKSMHVIGNTIWLNMYIASGTTTNAPGVLKSTDAGLTWSFYKATNLAAKMKYTFTNFSFKDANNGYALAGNGYVNSLHRTTDGGQTWSDSIAIQTSNVLLSQVAQVQTLPGTSTVFASGFDGTGPASWVSTDDGATWTKLVTPANVGSAASLSQIAFISSTTGFGAGTRQVLSYTPSVAVKFVINTASDPDTIRAASTVQVRGQVRGKASVLDWNAGTTVKATNVVNGVAGSTDYWNATGRFVPGDTVDFKFFSNAKPAIGPGSPDEHSGWEQDLATGNRFLVVGSSDTTLPLQFVNAGPKGAAQYWRPYVETDSVDVYFRVNMANNQDFNKVAMKMGVRGSAGGLDWGKTVFLKQEASHSNAGGKYDGTNFWSGAVKFPRTIAPDAGSTTTTVYYKFVIHNATDAPDAGPIKWEDGIVRNGDTLALEPGGGSNPARIFRYSQTMNDTTLAWKYWANRTSMPPAGTDTIMVTFSANLAKAVNTNSFKLGDTVIVRYGLAGSATASKDKQLVRQGLTGYNYAITDPSVAGTKIDASGNSNLIYQYYLIKNGIELRETYYNFDYKGTDQSLAERRMVPVTSKTIAVFDTSTNILSSQRQPFFRNTRKLNQVVTVTFKLDLRPAYWQVSVGDTLDDIQGPWRVTKSVRDSIYGKWGVSINGPAVGGWTTWGNTLYNDVSRKMFDDGTHGDATVGDHIYATQFTFGPDSANGRNLVGQEFKFGIRGGDNEGGRGGYGNNHVENIDDSSPNSTIDVQWGSMNPKFYSNWDYVNRKAILGVDKLEANVPLVYALEQNYPNPFNPTTTINYSIPNNNVVTLKVFNILGQEVATLVNAQQQAGKYQVTLDASKLASGVYLYRVEAGSFVSVKKMMLLK